MFTELLILHKNQNKKNDKNSKSKTVNYTSDIKTLN